MAVISRLQLDHPALGTAGGSALHAAVQALYQKIGDNLADRLFYVSALADTASVDLEHNYRVAFANIRWDLYLWDTGTQELTLITSATSPAISSFTVAATGGFTTTKATLTNNSGAARDLVLVMFNDPVQLDELTDAEITSPTNGQVLRHNGSQWANSSLGALADKTTALGADGVSIFSNANQTVTTSQNGRVFICSAMTTARNITLPASPPSGMLVAFKLDDVTGHTLVRGSGSHMIEGLTADYVMSAAYSVHTLIWDGVDTWWRI